MRNIRRRLKELSKLFPPLEDTGPELLYAAALTHLSAHDHTVRVDDSGRVWSSGGRAISLLNPTTKEWQHFDLGGTYGNVTGTMATSGSPRTATAARLAEFRRTASFPS